MLPISDPICTRLTWLCSKSPKTLGTITRKREIISVPVIFALEAWFRYNSFRDYLQGLLYISYHRHLEALGEYRQFQIVGSSTWQMTSQLLKKMAWQKRRWWRKGITTDYRSLKRHIQTMLHVELVWVLMCTYTVLKWTFLRYLQKSKYGLGLGWYERNIFF